jgi:hypothetical protein
LIGSVAPAKKDPLSQTNSSQCEGGSRHYPFGRGLADQATIAGTSVAVADIIRLPVSTSTNDANDVGKPLCLARPAEAIDELSAFETLARNVAKELLKLHYGRTESQDIFTFGSSLEIFNAATTNLTLDKATGDSFMVRLFCDSGAIQKRVSAKSLRARDPKTGNKLADSPFKDDESIESESASLEPMVTVTKAKRNPSLIPTSVEKKGRYGFAVQWADGATIIYSMLSIAKAAGGTLKQ